MKKAKLLWLDLEMTGLDPKHDLILEVAIIATDWNFKEVATYEGVIKNSHLKMEQRFLANHAFWQNNQATKQALVAQNKSGKKSSVVEDEILALVDQFFAKDQAILLAGNSIHMDRQFIRQYWPRLEARLHYRMLDVSAWKVVFEGKFFKKVVKPESHRALEDIKGSIAELQTYLETVTVRRG